MQTDFLDMHQIDFRGDIQAYFESSIITPHIISLHHFDWWNLGFKDEEKLVILRNLFLLQRYLDSHFLSTYICDLKQSAIVMKLGLSTSLRYTNISQKALQEEANNISETLLYEPGEDFPFEVWYVTNFTMDGNELRLVHSNSATGEEVIVKVYPINNPTLSKSSGAT